MDWCVTREDVTRECYWRGCVTREDVTGEGVLL
jgi:hypothetical protein